MLAQAGTSCTENPWRHGPLPHVLSVVQANQENINVPCVAIELMVICKHDTHGSLHIASPWFVARVVCIGHGLHVPQRPVLFSGPHGFSVSKCPLSPSTTMWVVTILASGHLQPSRAMPIIHSDTSPPLSCARKKNIKRP